MPDHTSVSESRAIVLVGFMGAGKSSVGPKLAQLLGWTFKDLDDHIQLQEGRTVPQIFAESGEAAFRRIEHRALRGLLKELKESSQVIAVGGGAFAQENNRALLESSKVPTVFLDAPPEELFRRCMEQKIDRPLRRDRHQFFQLYEDRRAHYATATACINTHTKEIEEIAREVAERLGLKPHLRGVRSTE